MRSTVLLAILAIGGPTSVTAETLVLKIDTAHIAESEATGGPSVVVEFQPESGVAVGEFTTRHVGQELRLKLGAEIVFAPVLVEPILGGAIQMSGNFTTEAALSLVSRLRSKDARFSVEADDR
jgi:preprotein translocase subunit SecD